MSLSTSHFGMMLFRNKKYESMPDSGKPKSKRFFPSFQKKKNKEVLPAEPFSEDNMTVALSHLSSNPPSPARITDDPASPLWTSTFEEEEDYFEQQTNASSDLLLIFTSASNDTDDSPLQVLSSGHQQPLSFNPFFDNGSDVVFRSPPPPRKTLMPSSLAPVQEQPSTTKPKRKLPKKNKKKQEQPKKPLPIDLDTYDEWHDDEDHWVEFVDERKDHVDWMWTTTAGSIDWEEGPMDEPSPLPILPCESDVSEYLPKDTSDEASFDYSTRSPTSVIVHQTASGEIEVCDPECPLRFFTASEQVEDEPPEDIAGYPFYDDEESYLEEEEEPDFFSLSFYQDQIAKFQSVESRQHMTKRLHNQTMALIGSVSEKMYKWEEEALSRFKTPLDTEDEADAVSIATSASEETRKKTNTSYFSTEAFSSNIFGGCNMIEPFLRFGQAEI